MISFPVILLRLLVALLIGAFIGLEREIHEQAAGMRTLALVSLGSALFTVISAYGFIDIARSHTYRLLYRGWYRLPGWRHHIL